MKNTEHRYCSCGGADVHHHEAERSRQIISAIFDSTQSFIILISLDYRIIFFNKKAMQATRVLYGRDLEVDDNFLSYQRDGDEAVFQAFRENFQKAIVTGGIVISEREMRFHDTSTWYRSEYTPVYDDGKIIGVALRIVDVSERKQRETKIEKQNEQLREISWSQSHQTRQPIATILGLIHILDKSSLTPDNKKIIDMLDAEVDKLDRIISEMVIRANSV